MRALVVGYGSIGSRHARILEELGCQVAAVTAREVEHGTRFGSIAEAVRAFAPGYAVIANDTAAHLEALAELERSGFDGDVLVEKPLARLAAELPSCGGKRVRVAYNMRFHPLSRRLAQLLSAEKILSVQAYVGQYLPSWRPGRDYREVYSASIEGGGGVLRDLSHELDLLNWLLGGWRTLTAQGGHLSHLEIDSDDVYSVMMTTERCPVVSVQMNYLDRLGRRRIIVNTDRHTFEADYVAGKLMVDGSCEEVAAERDESYREMHRALLGGRHDDLCSYEEGADVMRMIAAAEQAAKEGRWVRK